MEARRFKFLKDVEVPADYVSIDFIVVKSS